MNLGVAPSVSLLLQDVEAECDVLVTWVSVGILTAVVFLAPSGAVREADILLVLVVVPAVVFLAPSGAMREGGMLLVLVVVVALAVLGPLSVHVLLGPVYAWSRAPMVSRLLKRKSRS